MNSVEFQNYNSYNSDTLIQILENPKFWELQKSLDLNQPKFQGKLLRTLHAFILYLSIKSFTFYEREIHKTVLTRSERIAFLVNRR